MCWMDALNSQKDSVEAQDRNVGLITLYSNGFILVSCHTIIPLTLSANLIYIYERDESNDGHVCLSIRVKVNFGTQVILLTLHSFDKFAPGNRIILV
jgi:hypothetical protein